MPEVISSYCILIFLVPALTSLLILLAGKVPSVSRLLAFIGMSVTFIMTSIVFFESQTKVLTALNNQLRIDSLSGLLNGLIGLIGLIVIIYSFPYLKLEKNKGIIQERKIRSFYWQTMLFISTMLVAVSTNNIILLWVIIEATTLGSALLVAFYWNKNALEAGYKYLMLLTVGISFALFGCVIIYSGVASHVANGADPLQITIISSVVKQGMIAGNIILLAAVFFIVGFGTKAGIAPFHAWLPDAHAEAPTPISALLSGVMIKVGIYALIRTIAVFYSIYSTISLFVTILGIFTMLLGVFMMFFQENLKRFLAYSSVNHVGYIVMGFGLAGSISPSASDPANNGAYLGMYGALFHMLNHGIIKSLLFLSAGAIIYATGIRKIDELGGLSKKMPVTSFCFFIGSFAICGVPLLNGFMSKFTLFLAGAAIPGMLWTTIIAIISSIMALALYMHVAYRIFMGPMPEDIKKIDIKEVPASMWSGMLVLSLICFGLGIFPQLIYPILDKATHVVLALIAKGSL